MIKEIEVTGETVEIALRNASEQLGVDTDDLQYTILQTPAKKTLGLFGGRPAKISVSIEAEDKEELNILPEAEDKQSVKSQVKEVNKSTVTAPEKGSNAERASKYLKNVLSKMGLLDVEIAINEIEEGAELTLSGSDIGFIIGHRGETLDSLQYLASLVANNTGEKYYRITLDVGNYREKRKETLEALGKKMAYKSIKTGRNNNLEPMNPYERRIIHTAVQDIEGAKSWSEGEDMNRHVVVGPEGGERYPRRNNSRGGNRGGYGNRRPNNNYKPRTNNTKRPDDKPSVPKDDAPGTPLYGRIEK